MQPEGLAAAAASPSSPLRILFLVRALTVGGAEKQLLAAARGLRALGHEPRIGVFYVVGGPLHGEARRAGIPVIDLDKRGRWDTLHFLRALRRVIRDERIDVVYSYLPTSNVMAALARERDGPAVVWGIRSTNAGAASAAWHGRVALACERALASRADAIIVNSESGYQHHVHRGFPAARLRLVRNGIDTQHFRFNQAARERLRDKWGVGSDEPVALMAARHDPLKGIEQFLDACRAAKVRPIVAGAHAEPYTSHLFRYAEKLEFRPPVLWLDRQDDMPALLSAADIVCSASPHCEGSPNVLIEATACNAVTVGTDVGDTAEIVADSRRIARPGDVASLSYALRFAAEAVRRRDRNGPVPALLEQYAMEAMVKGTERVLCEAAGVAERGA